MQELVRKKLLAKLAVSQDEVVSVFKEEPSVGRITGPDCKEAQPLFKSGRLWVYRLEKNNQYILFLQGIKKNIAQVIVSKPGYPSVQIQQFEVRMADGSRIPTFLFTPINVMPFIPRTTVLTRTPYLYDGLRDWTSLREQRAHIGDTAFARNVYSRWTI